MITNLIKKTAAEWATENPVLAEGQLGLDLTANTFKVGNGQSKWLDLPTGLSVTNSVKNFNPSNGISLKGDSFYSVYTQSGAFTISIQSDTEIGGGTVLPIVVDGNAITITGATQHPSNTTTASTTSGETDEYIFWKTSTGIYYAINNLGVLS
jgi:hypothetical protein